MSTERKSHFHNPLHYQESKEGLDPRKILVYIDSHANLHNPYDPSHCALNVALDLAQKNHGDEVTIICVLEVPRNLPLRTQMLQETYRLDQLLEDAEEIARHVKNIKVVGQLLQTRHGGVTHALLDEARELNADIIVIGTERDKFFIEDKTSFIALDSLRRHAVGQVITIQPAQVQQ